MSEQEQQSIEAQKPFTLYILLIVVIVGVVAAIWFYPSASDKAPAPTITSTTIEPESVVPEEDESTPPDLFEGRQPTQALVIDPIEDDTAIDEPEFVEPEPIIDESDGAIKSALVSVASSPHFAKYLVNEGLLQKFVINVNSLANQALSPNNQLIEAPERKFEVYKQADREWIDASSFQRYNGYVEVLESLEIEELMAIYENYKPMLVQKYAEISRPGASFDDAVIDAIDELLDTPKVPAPIEVYSDSVMYKFKDERLESLSAPQKQLIRTGPENTRKIKAVLRDIKRAIQEGA